MKTPNSCKGVKCMQVGCPNPALHKVGELNVWDKEMEADGYNDFNWRQTLTTYLCRDHFEKLMYREVYYGDLSDYKP